MAATTPTPFKWPSGPASVEVSGDWDEWKEKFALDKQNDGSFAGQVRALLDGGERRWRVD